jgi:membrane peptidoglycan carboxypeptidase
MRLRLSVLLVGIGLLFVLYFDPLMSAFGGLLSYGQAGRAVQSYPARLREELRGKGARYVPYAEIPLCARQGIASVEDKRFFTNSGIDLFAIVRVVGMTVVNDHTDHGGSTITQQLARIIVNEPRNEPSARAEVLGMMKILRYTLIVNYEFTKPEIMELYLNSVYFGKHAQGIAQAAKAYFGRDLERLSLGQCLYLTGLPQAPSIFGRDPAGPGAMQRYRHLLATMVRNEYLSTVTAAGLMRESLGLIRSPESPRTQSTVD